jgi:hypothetical protein
VVKQRTPKDRRAPAFDPEVMAQFRKLEAMSPRRRERDENYEEDYKLHRSLGLYEERRFSQVSVFDREARPCWGPDYPAHWAWHKVRAVRRKLLEALDGDPEHAGA